MRVGIVGGGPAGLTAAVAAQRAGFDVTLFERAQEFQPGGVGITIASNGLRVLSELGLLDRFESVSERITKATVETSRGARLVTLDYEHLSGPFSYFAAVRRFDLYAILRDAAADAGCRVLHGMRCVNAGADGSLAFENGDDHSFDVVIGADGVNSSVRESLRLTRSRRRVGRPVVQWIADVQAPPVAREVWGPNGGAALVFPLLGGRMHCAFSAPDNWRDVALAGAHGWLDSWNDYPDQVKHGLDAVDAWDLVRYDEIEQIVARPWFVDKAVLMGDAAHAMAPWAGQGANSAMVDAVTFVGLLRNRVSVPEAAREYERLRRSEVTKFQRFSRAGAMTRRWTSTPLRTTRGLSLRLLDRSVWARKRLMRMLSGV